MDKNKINGIVDGAAIVTFVFLASTGLVLEDLLPSGSGRWRSVLGFSRHEWGAFHLGMAAVFFGILAVHLFMHWRWILSMARGVHSEGSMARLVAGIFGLTMLILIAIVPWISGVEARG